MTVLKFGGKLDLFLLERGLTSGEAARATQIPERTMERIRGGYNAPSAAHFVRIIKYLKINLDAIEPQDLEEAAP